MKPNVLSMILGLALAGTGASSLAQATRNNNPTEAGPPLRTSLSAGAPIAFDLLPQAVRQTLQKYSLGAPIADVEKGSINGQTVYQATFQHNGRTIALQVAENGGLVRNAVNDRYLASVGMLPARTGTYPAPPMAVPDWHVAPARIPLANPTAVSLQSLPEAVREKFLSYTAGSELGGIQQGELGGRTVYEAEVQPHGQKVVLRVDRGGAFVNDQVNDRFLADYATHYAETAAGQAPGFQTVANPANLTSLAPLRNAAAVQLPQLPAPVRTTLDAQSTGAPISGISLGLLNGKKVYDATYTHAGQPITVRIGEDGSILGSQAGSP